MNKIGVVLTDVDNRFDILRLQVCEWGCRWYGSLTTNLAMRVRFSSPPRAYLFL